MSPRRPEPPPRAEVNCLGRGFGVMPWNATRRQRPRSWGRWGCRPSSILVGRASGGDAINFDTGACQRNFDLTMRIVGLFDIVRWPRDELCLDFGADLGIFARTSCSMRVWTGFFAYPGAIPFWLISTNVTT